MEQNSTMRVEYDLLVLNGTGLNPENRKSKLTMPAVIDGTVISIFTHQGNSMYISYNRRRKPLINNTIKTIRQNL